MPARSSYNHAPPRLVILGGTCKSAEAETTAPNIKLWYLNESTKKWNSFAEMPPQVGCCHFVNASIQFQILFCIHYVIHYLLNLNNEFTQCHRTVTYKIALLIKLATLMLQWVDLFNLETQYTYISSQWHFLISELQSRFDIYKSIQNIRIMAQNSH